MQQEGSPLSGCLFCVSSTRPEEQLQLRSDTHLPGEPVAHPDHPRFHTHGGIEPVFHRSAVGNRASPGYPAHGGLSR